MRRPPNRYTTMFTKKGQNSAPKNRSLLMHIAELSTPVVKLDIKVINASLTQNQFLAKITTRMLRYRDRATPLN